MYIYLSNENPKIVDVFFDDFLIKLKHSPLIQVDDFYPAVYPAIFSGRLGIKELAGKRSGELENGFLFQGQEHQNEAGWDSLNGEIMIRQLEDSLI